MEIRAEKTELLTNSVNVIQREIKVKRQKLDTVRSFKCLGIVVSDDGSKPQILLRIAQPTVPLTKLKKLVGKPSEIDSIQSQISSKTSCGKKGSTKRHHQRHHQRQPVEQQFPIQHSCALFVNFFFFFLK